MNATLMVTKMDKLTKPPIMLYHQLPSTLKAPVSTYKFSKLISIHFLKELVERI